MRYSDLREAATKRPWTFYHGTKSPPFDQFDPSAATKGDAFWNPLGHGMYATNNPSFASNFGPEVHAVMIPAGATYKRITLAQWQNSVGFGLVIRALKKAFRRIGESYEHWDKGVLQPHGFNLPKMSRAALLDALIAHAKLPQEEEAAVRTRAVQFTDDQLRDTLKQRLAWNKKRSVDRVKQQKISNFRFEASRELRRHDPYTGLYETSAIVGLVFQDAALSEAYEQTLPEESTRTFSKWDFVVFTETNDVLGFNDKENTSEVVIYNPAMQRTVARPIR